MIQVIMEELTTAEHIDSIGIELEKAFYPFLNRYIIGTTGNGKKIFMYKIGHGKKAILLTAGVHGRESVNPAVLMKMLFYYCQKYKKEERILSYDTKELFAEYCIIVVPLLNPDGYTIARTLIPDWKGNGYGVDINRNFPSKSWRADWEGDKAASEYETRALMACIQEYDSVGYIDYHSRGNSIYYYRKDMSEDYNERQKQIAERLATMTTYTLERPEKEVEEGDSGGNTVHYYSEYAGMPAITIETVPEIAVFPLSMGYCHSVYEQIKHTPLVFIT